MSESPWGLLNRFVHRCMKIHGLSQAEVYELLSESQDELPGLDATLDDWCRLWVKALGVAGRVEELRQLWQCELPEFQESLEQEFARLEITPTLPRIEEVQPTPEEVRRLLMPQPPSPCPPPSPALSLSERKLAEAVELLRQLEERTAREQERTMVTCAMCGERFDASSGAAKRIFYTGRRVGWDRERTSYKGSQYTRERSIYYSGLQEHVYYACKACWSLHLEKQLPYWAGMVVGVVAGFIAIGIVHPEHLFWKVVLFLSTGLFFAGVVICSPSLKDQDQFTKRARGQALLAASRRATEYAKTHRRKAYFHVLTEEEHKALLSTYKEPDFRG